MYYFILFYNFIYFIIDIFINYNLYFIDKKQKYIKKVKYLNNLILKYYLNNFLFLKIIDTIDFS